MTAEEPNGLWVLSPEGEVKLLPEHRLKEDDHNCDPEVTCYHTETPSEVCAALTDR